MINRCLVSLFRQCMVFEAAIVQKVFDLNYRNALKFLGSHGAICSENYLIHLTASCCLKVFTSARL